MKISNPYGNLDLNLGYNANQFSKQPDLSRILDYQSKNPDHYILNLGSGNSPKLNSNVVNLDFMNAGIIDVLGSASSLPFRSDSFHAVFCLDVLEHVPNPFNVALEIKRVTKFNGYIECTVPFLFPFHDVPDHYCNFSTSGIQQLFPDTKLIDVGVSRGPWFAMNNIVGIYKKMLKRVYNDSTTSWVEKIRVFIIYRLLSWGMKFDHRTIKLTENEKNVLAAGVYIKTKNN